MQHSLTKRISALIALAAILFVMLFSAFFIQEHMEHECSGSDCPVCAILVQCKNNIKSIGTAAVIAAAVMPMFVSLSKNTQYSIAGCVSSSLISQKVRMNN